MKKTKFLLMLVTMAVLLPGMFTMANASTITITWDNVLGWINDNSPKVAGYGTDAAGGQKEINDFIADLGLTELYKNDVGIGPSGPLSGSYQVTFSPPGDPMDALIDYIGGPWVGQPAYLLVKDGDTAPTWVLLDLSLICDWDGRTEIFLDGFWPDTGAISHVTLYGSNQVPIPAAAWLLGSGLVGFLGIRRLRRKVS